GDQPLLDEALGALGHTGDILAVVLPGLRRAAGTGARAELEDRATRRRVDRHTTGREGADVGTVKHTVAVDVGVTGVTLAVGVEVELIAVGGHRAIVEVVGHAVAV